MSELEPKGKENQRSSAYYSIEQVDGFGNVVGSTSNSSLLNPLIKIGHGKNVLDKRWHSRECNIATLFQSLTKHKESATKDGPAFLQGEAIDGQRTAKTMRRLWLAGLDVDSADDMQQVLKRLFELNVFALTYTTYSNMNTSSDVAETSYATWAKKVPESRPAYPTPDSMGEYLAEAGKLSSALSKTVAACPREMTVRGMVYRVTHDPAPRFRIIFPLAQSFEFLKDGTTLAERSEEWKLRLYALADLVGVVMDESCVDPSRLFYLPTHAPGRPFETYVIMGDELLDIEALTITDETRKKAGGGGEKAQVRKESGKRESASADAHSAQHDSSAWYGQDWTNWRDVAEGFQFANLLRDYGLVRRDVDADKVEIECPFDHEHSNAGDPNDTACFVTNGSPGKPFVAGCQHNACKARKTTEFVAEMLHQGLFPEGEAIFHDLAYAKVLPITKAQVVASELDRLTNLVDGFTAATPDTEYATVENAIAGIWNVAPPAQRKALIVKLAQKAGEKTPAKTETRIAKIAQGITKRAAKTYEAGRTMKAATEAAITIGGRVFASVSKAVETFNENAAYVTLGGKTRVARLDLSPIEFMHPRDGEEWFANWQAFDVKDGEKVLVSAFKAWKTSVDRKQFSRVGFEPGRSSAEAPDLLNLFRGLAVEPKPEASCKAILHHIFEVLCDGNPRHFEYFIKWCADIVQNPGVKPGVAMVLLGKKGIGKTLFAVYLAKILGTTYTKVSDEKHLLGNFNKHTAGKLCVLVEEAMFAGDKKGEGVLKDKITSETVLIEPKGIDAFESRAYERYIFASNAVRAIPATPDERRFFALQVPDIYKVGRDDDHDLTRGDPEYFHRIIAEMKGDGPAALLAVLNEVDLTGFDIRNPPITPALKMQISANLDQKTKWLRDLLADGAILDEGGEEISECEGWSTHAINVPRARVFESYNRAVIEFRQGNREASPNEIGMFLAKALPEVDGKRAKNKGRFYVFPPLPELRAAFEKRFNVVIETVDFRDETAVAPACGATDEALHNDVAVSFIGDRYFEAGRDMECEAGIALSEAFGSLHRADLIGR